MRKSVQVVVTQVDEGGAVGIFVTMMMIMTMMMMMMINVGFADVGDMTWF